MDYLPETPEVESAFRTLVRAAARELGMNGDSDSLAERQLLAQDMIVARVVGEEEAARRRAIFAEAGWSAARSRRPLPDTPEVSHALGVLLEAAEDDREMVATYVYDSMVEEFISADLALDRSDRINPRFRG